MDKELELINQFLGILNQELFLSCTDKEKQRILNYVSHRAGVTGGCGTSNISPPVFNIPQSPRPPIIPNP